MSSVATSLVSIWSQVKVAMIYVIGTESAITGVIMTLIGAKYVGLFML